MKLLFYRFLILSILSVTISCKKGKKEVAETPTKMEEIMAIHDEVMPKMGRLAKYTAELKAKVDTTTMGQQYETAMKDLQNANTSMMDWMMGFGNRFDSEEILDGKELTPQKKEWLVEEEKKVKELRNQINSSIARAEQLLSKDE